MANYACSECSEKFPDIQVTDRLLNRLFGKNAKKYGADIDGDYRVCRPSRTDKPKDFCDEFQESQGINQLLENGLDHYSTSVGKRASALVNLPILCYQERKQLQKCYKNNGDCAMTCAPVVKNYIKCANECKRDVEENKIKQMKDKNKVWKTSQEYIKK